MIEDYPGRKSLWAWYGRNRGVKGMLAKVLTSIPTVLKGLVFSMPYVLEAASYSIGNVRFNLPLPLRTWSVLDICVYWVSRVETGEDLDPEGVGVFGLRRCPLLSREDEDVVNQEREFIPIE